MENSSFKVDKPFRTIEEQLMILQEERDLKIIDKEYAQYFLSRHTYYDLVNGYKDCFLDPSTEEEKYLDSATFEKLIYLYKFDRDLRNVVTMAISDVESILHCALAITLGEIYGEKQDDYLKTSNFRPGRRYKNKKGEYYNQRDRLLKNMRLIINSKEEPMKHYKDKHHNIPPWILVEGMTLGNFCIFYELSHENVKIKIISKCTNISEELIAEKEKEFFRKSLDVMCKFRNRAAHGRRIFNYRTKEHLTFREDIHTIIGVTKEEFNKQGKGKNDFLALVLSLAHIYRFDGQAFFDNFCLYFQLHCSYYKENDPENFDEILKIMSMEEDPYKTLNPILKKRKEPRTSLSE